MMPLFLEFFPSSSSYSSCLSFEHYLQNVITNKVGMENCRLDRTKKKTRYLRTSSQFLLVRSISVHPLEKALYFVRFTLFQFGTTQFSKCFTTLPHTRSLVP
jgi:hypothetical protein